MNVPTNRFADVVAARTSEATSRTIDGEGFAFAAGVDDAPIWGRSSDTIWSPGEPLMIFAPEGVGKTTMMQRLIRARLGLDDELLGFPVSPSEAIVLYVAADRPRQAQRSFRRMVAEDERDILRDRLRVHRGPLTFNIAREPERLAAWAHELGATDVFLDSLGALVPALSDDATGSAVAQALQHVVSAGLEIAVNHHPRKANSDNRKPRELADVYGSRWLTAPCGSVVCLWGDPGDPVVEFRHLKTPADEVGPFQVQLDPDTGGMSVVEGTDLLAILRASPNGLSAPEAAKFMRGGSDRALVQKGRRQLERLVVKDLAHRREGRSERGAIRSADRYFALVRDEHTHEHTALSDHDEHTTSTHEHAFDETAGQSEHTDEHARDTPLTSTQAPPPLGGVPVPVQPWPPESQACPECSALPHHGGHFATCSSFVPRRLVERGKEPGSIQEAADA